MLVGIVGSVLWSELAWPEAMDSISIAMDSVMVFELRDCEPGLMVASLSLVGCPGLVIESAVFSVGANAA